MEGNSLLIAASIFVLIFMVVMLAHYGYYASAQAIEDRLAELSVQARTETKSIDRLGARLVRWAAHRLPAPKNDTPQNEKFSRMLDYAGFHAPGAVRTFSAIRIAAIGVLAIGGAIYGFATDGTLSAILYGVAGAMAGSVAPTFVIGRLGTKRQRKIRRELGDIIDLLVVSIESGLGLFQAIRTVGREAMRMGQKMGSELQMLTASLSSGGTLGQGLRAMAERTGVEEMKALAAILIQSEKLGSQLGPALRASSDSLRTRRRLAAEEAAQKATIKMLVPLVSFVLPAMMAVILGPAVVQIFGHLSPH
jgi:tight adherence protein C